MSTRRGPPIPAAVRRAQEWQRLSWTTMNQLMGHCLHGCASVAMAHTPRQAVAALHRTQTGLLVHSAHALAQVERLWRKQSTELLALRV